MDAFTKYINQHTSDGEKVEIFLELCTVWEEWNRMNNADVPTKMFYIMYGWLNCNPNWIKNEGRIYGGQQNLIRKRKLTQPKTKHQTTRMLDTVCILISIEKNNCVNEDLIKR